ncbi:MAG: hypothetical protein ACOYW9_02555 [Deinococcota bacterium]|uniref:hypothetical protein n=1 Tax=Allomeiothermus silvanus TaxID=52022 RepID=UPI002352340A|nr:hypothetical protein [Allomeiothermus silvanus]MBI5811214.1 hypothetical protein [Allomeiothermus silvanus]
MYFWEFLFIRTSLVYLIYTALTGTAFYVWPSLTGFFKTAHVHAGLVGFFLSMVMGVAYWMMPRPGRMRQDTLEAATYIALNTGLALRLVLEPWILYSGTESLRPILVASGLLQLGAIGIFAYAMTKRVVTSEMLAQLRAKREAKGQE